MSRMLIMLCALLMLIGCDRDAIEIPRNAADDPKVRAYQVPPERAQDLASALATLLANGGEGAASLGRAVKVGEGTLLVLAPVSVQPSIAEAIDEVLQQQPAAPAGVAAAVSLRFWVLEEVAEGAGDSALSEDLDPVLETIRAQFQVDGLRLDDAGSIAIRGHDSSRVRTGKRTHIEARMNRTGEQSSLAVLLDSEQLEIRSTIPLVLDRYLVLAEAGTDSEPVRRRFVVMQASAMHSID